MGVYFFMLYGTDTDWTRMCQRQVPVISLNQNPYDHFATACGLIQGIFGKVSVEQEVFLFRYYLILNTLEHTSKSVTNQDLNKMGPWIAYLKRKYKFSKIKYFLIAWDFYEAEPLMQESKQMITALGLLTPTKGLNDLKSRLSQTGIMAYYMKRQIEFLRKKPRLLFHKIDPSAEADIYLNLLNAEDAIRNQ